MRQGAMINRSALYELGNRYRHVDIEKNPIPYSLPRGQNRYGVMISLNFVATEKGIMRLSVFKDKWLKWKTRKPGHDFLEDMPDLYSPPKAPVVVPKVIKPAEPLPKAKEKLTGLPKTEKRDAFTTLEIVASSVVVPHVPLVDNLRSHRIGKLVWSVRSAHHTSFDVWFRWYPTESAWGFIANGCNAVDIKYIQLLIDRFEIDADVADVLAADKAIAKLDAKFGRGKS